MGRYMSRRLVFITLVLAAIVLGAKVVTTARAAVDGLGKESSPITVDEDERSYFVDYGDPLTIPVTVKAEQDEYVAVVPQSRDVSTTVKVVRLDPRDDRTATVELTLNPNGNLDAGKHRLPVSFQPLDGSPGQTLDVTLNVQTVALTITSIDPVTKEFGETVDPSTVSVETTAGPKNLAELGLSAPSFADDYRAGTYRDRLNPTRSPNYEVDGAPKIDVTVEPMKPQLIGLKASALPENAKVGESSITGIALNPHTNEMVYGAFSLEAPDEAAVADDDTGKTMTATCHFVPFDSVNYRETTATVEIPIL